MTNFIYSPLEQFEVSSIIHVQSPMLNYMTISLTNIGLYIILAVTLIIGLHVMSTNNIKLIPSRWGLMLEAIYDTVNGVVRSQIGARQEQYLPLLYSLFIFILISNLIGNITYSFAITSTLMASVGTSVIIFLGVTILGISLHGYKFVYLFVPSGVPAVLIPLLVPIEIVSYLSRSLSLGVRLFANILSGHALLTILSGFIAPAFASGLFTGVLTLIPFALFLLIVALEVAVSFIQAYVFLVLTCSYIKDTTYLH